MHMRIKQHPTKDILSISDTESPIFIWSCCQLNIFTHSSRWMLWRAQTSDARCILSPIYEDSKLRGRREEEEKKKRKGNGKEGNKDGRLYTPSKSVFILISLFQCLMLWAFVSFIPGLLRETNIVGLMSPARGRHVGCWARTTLSCVRLSQMHAHCIKTWQVQSIHGAFEYARFTTIAKIDYWNVFLSDNLSWQNQG